MLILDEPTNGLDPQGIAWLRGLLGDYARDGRTVLLSSHALLEIEQIANQVIIINEGRLAGHGTVAQDNAQKPSAYAGIVTLTPTGRISIHSHHATNALSVLLQFAVLTTHGLADRLSIAGQFRWSTQMGVANWEDLLRSTPAGSTVTKSWKNAPQL